MIGNYIADHIRGNKFDHFNPEIQQGILLHREIDTYTDAHPIVRKSKRRLHERYGHYDGVIIDIFYDHYLAKNWKTYSEIPLEVFSKSVYSLLKSNKEILPEKSVQFLKYMIEYDILYHYQYIEGIQKVLNGMNYRTKGKSKMNLAIEDLNLFHQEFENDFTAFFEDLRNFSNQKLKEITHSTL